MVRILKIKELGEKKRELLARSEIHRQTLTLEMANVKLSFNLLKKRLHVLKTIYRLLGFAVPVGGLLFGHGKEPAKKRGFLSRLLSGFNLANRIKSFFNSGKAESHGHEEPGEVPRF
jgi:hypothetical protein